MSNYYNDDEEPKTLYDLNKDKLPRYDMRDIQDNNIQKAAHENNAGGGRYYPLDDTGNANRFVDRYGDCFRYNVNDKCWMIFDGATWRKDNTQEIKRYADKLIDFLRYELRTMDTASDSSYTDGFYKNIKRLSNSSGKKAMLDEVVHLGKTAVGNNDFDKQPELLNCKNGVVNLKTGAITMHDRNLMMSKCTNIDVDMENEPKRWLKYLDEVFQGNKELIDYIQCAVGYSLTGYNIEQCMFQLSGYGGNGKSVFIDTLQAIMGDYAIVIDTATITAKKFNNAGSASPDKAKINGARLLCANEPDEGTRLDESFVKILVGGDMIVARNLFGNEFEFKPIGKLWVSTNYQLTIRGRDDGIWRRQRIIPFNRKFEEHEKDKMLTFKLAEEAPQILGWAVKGAIRWLNGKTAKLPAIIDDATRDYRTEMDIVAMFLKDNISITPNGREKAGDVYKAYVKWCRLGNEFQMSQSAFGKEMTKRYQKRLIAGYYYYMGFVLKENDHAYIFTKENM